MKQEFTQAEKDTISFGYIPPVTLAKAVAFRSLAIQALKEDERISATISAYYSLFHLAITLVYLCPDKLKPSLLIYLRDKRGEGKLDPSKDISHADALEFVKVCVEEGLDTQLHTQLAMARELRKFVNYGPQVTFDPNEFEVSSGPCNYRPKNCDKLVSVISKLFPLALEWAYKHSPSRDATKIAVETCSVHFRQPDLFHSQWCSKACIEDSLVFIRELEQKMNTL